MLPLFSLGPIYISDFLKEGELPTRGIHNLSLVMEEDTRAVRLETTAPLNSLFGKYFYRSGINESMKSELRNIVNSIFPLISLKKKDIWLDIASNDGTLLSFVSNTMIRIGIDPCDDSYKHDAEKHADLIIQDYFNKQIYSQSIFGNQKANVITSIAMFYDVDNPDEFCKDVYDVLDDNGLWVMQLSHSGLMIEQLAFDNILSEHVYYYSLGSLKIILERNGFQIVDCQLNDTNGGSFRVYIRKKIADLQKFATQPYRDVCNYRCNSLLEYEKKLKLDMPETWHLFYDRILELKEKTVSFIKSEKEKGKRIYAYAASTKGNTILQFFGLDNSLITAVAERSDKKYGLKTVGTNIPIISEEEMRKNKPDYLFILAWHFIKPFIEREKEYLNSGGKFIVPCPKFDIIEK